MVRLLATMLVLLRSRPSLAPMNDEQMATAHHRTSTAAPGKARQQDLVLLSRPLPSDRADWSVSQVPG